MKFELGIINKEELITQIKAIEKLLDNPNAMACLSESECLSLENGLLNLLGEINDKLEDKDELTELVKEKINKNNLE